MPEIRENTGGDIMFERSKLALAAGIIIVLIIGGMIFSPFTIIGPGERGIIVRLGKVDMSVILGEGFHWRMPVITTIHKMTVQIQKSEVPATAATKDLQNVFARMAVNWKIDPTKVNVIFQTIGDENDVLGDIMTPAVNEVLKAATAKRNAQTILVERTSLKEEVDTAFKNRMEKYGIIIIDVSLVDFRFSDEFQRAIEEKQVMEQESQKAVYIAKKAEAEAQAAINKARGESEAQRLQKITLSGIMLKKMWIDKWDGKLPKVMSGNGSGMILDLKQISDNEQ